MKEELSEFFVDEKSLRRVDLNYDEFTLYLQPSSRFIKYWDYIQIFLNILCYWFCLF